MDGSVALSDPCYVASGLDSDLRASDTEVFTIMLSFVVCLVHGVKI